MLGIEILGAHGSAAQAHHCTCFKLGENILLDAGDAMASLGEKVVYIEHILLTHSHFDHIRDLPFIIETYYEKRQTPLKIYGLPRTLEALENHLFNGVIWPPFHQIIHPNFKKNSIEFIPITFDTPFELGVFQFTPFPSNHTVDCCSYLIRHANSACIISSDTYLTHHLNEVIHQNPDVTSLFIECSFPSRLEALAKLSKHLTPKLLKEQLSGIHRPIHTYLYHLKPNFEAEITQEIAQNFNSESLHQISGFLESGQSIDLFSEKPVVTRIPSSIYCAGQQKQLTALLNISQILSSEHNLEHLLDMIIDEAMKFTQADAGTLYRYNKTQQQLEFTVVRNNTLNIHMGGTQQEITWPNVSLYQDEVPNISMVAATCALEKRPLKITDVYSETHFDFSGTRAFDKRTGYQSKSMLVIPLLTKDNELLGVLQLINKHNEHQESIAFSEQDQTNTMALASQATLSLSNALLVHQMEDLFESFATAINIAFDEKCSFTGIHIRHVAKLAELISHAIHQDDTVYADIHYSHETLHSIKIAALVHDIGKISTPEFILHKATKLEKNIDRIHLVALRIELAKQAILIEGLSQYLPRGLTLDNLLEKHHSAMQLLEEDGAFLHKMNSGRESLAPGSAERIHQIAQRQYPFKGKNRPLLESDEVLNLCIQRGTLNETERQIIMNHARLSLEMLQTLPFPEKYGQIVDIASNHHEKLNGQGYPRGLTAHELTLEDQIMVLADLYEALSSKERPYKAPMAINQVVDILCDMANKGEIDKTLLRFFFEKGIYKQYNTYLNPEQITDFELKFNE
ncbi:HD domain-containing phosphohydrolase [Thiomicrorhabdus arctica]|uniref:HD domain-containing phosphohydrolase n=1 Tax=Thiomicrorhabdus arctica TaxID=131540 RepID=UPI00036F331A|nr:HD domain-containing phosphohydrolase [Thiomicrorhabdus arctica]